jgi:hypothetical protein
MEKANRSTEVQYFTINLTTNHQAGNYSSDKLTGIRLPGTNIQQSV